MGICTHPMNNGYDWWCLTRINEACTVFPYEAVGHCLLSLITTCEQTLLSSSDFVVRSCCHHGNIHFTYTLLWKRWRIRIADKLWSDAFCSLFHKRIPLHNVVTVPLLTISPRRPKRQTLGKQTWNMSCSSRAAYDEYFSKKVTINTQHETKFFATVYPLYLADYNNVLETSVVK